MENKDLILKALDITKDCLGKYNDKIFYSRYGSNWESHISKGGSNLETQSNKYKSNK